MVGPFNKDVEGALVGPLVGWMVGTLVGFLAAELVVGSFEGDADRALVG